ncbi:MAG TPA: nitrate reductase, partial [SAR324 cluster bacterium]|nr:nitrate reductase [SAR324 cluster bacterium]
MNVSLSRRRFLEATAGLGVPVAASPLNARDPIRLAGQPVRYQGETAYATPTICEMCFWRCGILGKTREGKLLNVTGNPDHPLSRGRICARGLSGVQLYYDPDRLKKPL